MFKVLVVIFIIFLFSCSGKKEQVKPSLETAEKIQFSVDTNQLNKIDESDFFRLEGSASQDEDFITYNEITTNQGNNLIKEINGTKIPVLLPDNFMMQSIFDKKLMDFYSNADFYIASHNVVNKGAVYNVEISSSLNGFEIELDTLSNVLEDTERFSFTEEGAEYSFSKYGIPYHMSISRDSIVTDYDTISSYSDSLLLFKLIKSLKLLDYSKQ